jgi:hypothetical protein
VLRALSDAWRPASIPTVPNFQPLPNRDAWATIRGFVYQVDVTLLRWFELKGAEELALECGEDIDRIGPAIADSKSLEYLVEQVKYRESAISLRSSEAVASIASFHAQKILNPHIDLRFRLLTNASPTEEKPPSPLTGASGIRLWCEIQRGTLSSADLSEAFLGILALLRSAVRPDGFNQKRWEAFQEFLAACTAEDLHDLILRFEWGFEAGDLLEIQARVCDALVREGRARAGHDAQRKHAHLFSHVIRILSERGPKRLSIADLGRALSSESLAAADPGILKAIGDLRDDLVSRIADVERVTRDLHPKGRPGAGHKP